MRNGPYYIVRVVPLTEGTSFQVHKGYSSLILKQNVNQSSASAFVKNPMGILEMIDEALSLVNHAVNLRSSIRLGDTRSSDNSLMGISL